MSNESREVPDVHLVFDDHGLQPLGRQPCSEPVESMTAALQLSLTEFHGGNVGHGGEYTDLSGIDTGDLGRFWAESAPICIERAAITAA